MARGALVRGLEHAAAVVEESANGDTEQNPASTALQAAADRIRAAADGDAAHTAVDDVMTYLMENLGEIDGNRVAELSNVIGGAG